MNLFEQLKQIQLEMLDFAEEAQIQRVEDKLEAVSLLQRKGA